MTARPARATVMDASAITLSGLCLVHCLLLPLAIPFASVAGALAEMEWVHKAFVLAALPISVLALLRSDGIPGRAGFTQLAILGLALLIAGAFIHELHDYEVPLTVAGALLLAGAHVWRWRAHTAG